MYPVAISNQETAHWRFDICFEAHPDTQSDGLSGFDNLNRTCGCIHQVDAQDLGANIPMPERVIGQRKFLLFQQLLEFFLVAGAKSRITIIGLLARHDYLLIAAQDILRCAFGDNLTGVQENSAGTERPHCTWIVRNEKDGNTAFLHLLQPADAAMLKDCIADRQGLINDQNIGRGRNRNRESQTHIHAAGVGLYRLMDELSNFSKTFDLGKQRFSFFPRKPEERGIHEDIFDSRKFRVEPCAELEQGRDSPVVPDTTMCCFEGAGNDLEERRFATAVWTNDAGGGACLNFKAYISQCPKFTMPFPKPARNHLAQPVSRPIVNAIKLGNAFHAQRNAHICDRTI